SGKRGVARVHGDGSEARWGPAVPTPVRALLPLTARELTHTLLLALAYWAAAGASLAWAVVPGVGPVLWPPAGIALAALALGGPKLWPGVFAGQRSEEH